jgi:hypothetical protein
VTDSRLSRLRELLNVVRYSEFPTDADSAIEEIMSLVPSETATVEEPSVYDQHNYQMQDSRNDKHDEPAQDWKDIFEVYRERGCSDAWLYQQIAAHDRRATRTVTPSHGGQRKLEDMPTDAVIKAICAWMEWDYADKAMRAEASELYHAIRRASSIAESAKATLMAEDVEWVVNDIAELGVKIGNQFFWLYKGHSLVYGSHDDPERKDGICLHDDGKPMHWRPVGKREFGECCHPINYKDPTRHGTVSLDDSDDWKPLPVPPESGRKA